METVILLFSSFFVGFVGMAMVIAILVLAYMILEARITLAALRLENKKDIKKEHVDKLV